MTVCCVRCGRTESLEEDHIIPRCKGGGDEPENKRWLCTACHDYRHARDKIIHEINRQLKLAETGQHNPGRLSMWIFRLGVLEALNTPDRIKETGKYIKYYDLHATHWEVWSPRIKMHTKESKRILKKMGLKPSFERQTMLGENKLGR